MVYFYGENILYNSTISNFDNKKIIFKFSYFIKKIFISRNLF